jgi:hypothetical protein
MHVRNLGHPDPPALPLRVQPLPWESLASSYRLCEEYLPWLCRKEDFLYLERLLYLDQEPPALLRFPALASNTNIPKTIICIIVKSDDTNPSPPTSGISFVPCLPQNYSPAKMHRHALQIPYHRHLPSL